MEERYEEEGSGEREEGKEREKESEAEEKEREDGGKVWRRGRYCEGEIKGNEEEEEKVWRKKGRVRLGGGKKDVARRWRNKYGEEREMEEFVRGERRR